MLQPTFIGIGAQKCASTWIYSILKDHPEVSLGTPKEINFFSYYYDYGVQWYLKHFTPRPEARAVGEISPSYFHEPTVPHRLKSSFPDVKILVSLRDPVERVISNHKHEVRTGHFRGEDLSLEAGLANNPMYIEQGRYATHLSRWLEFFPQDQLLIILFDDVLAKPAAVAQTIYRFLGIDEHHRSAGLMTPSNVSYVNRYESVEKTRKAIRVLAKQGGMERLWQWVGNLGLRSLYRKMNRASSNTVIPPISEATKARLRSEFEEEIIRTEQLLKRDLAHWR